MNFSQLVELYIPVNGVPKEVVEIRDSYGTSGRVIWRKSVVPPGPTPPTSQSNNEIWYQTEGNVQVTPFLATDVSEWSDNHITSHTYYDSLPNFGSGWVIEFKENIHHITHDMFNATKSGVVNANKMTKISIPSSIQSVDSYAFYNCKKLEWPDTAEFNQLNVPTGCTSIGDYAYYNCSYACTGFNMPSTITSIGDYAFNADMPTSPDDPTPNNWRVKIEAITPPTIGANTFMPMAYMNRIYVPYDSVSAYQNADNWSAYSSIISGGSMLFAPGHQQDSSDESDESSSSE